TESCAAARSQRGRAADERQDGAHAAGRARVVPRSLDSSIVSHHYLVNADRSDLDYCISPYVMKVHAAACGHPEGTRPSPRLPTSISTCCSRKRHLPVLRL